MKVVPTTFPALLSQVVEDFADDLMVVDHEAGVELTFAQFGDAVGTAAAALVASGVEPGEAVAIWAPNCWEWEVAALAVAAVGARIAPINTRFRGPEAGAVLRKAKAPLLFTVNRFLKNDYPAMLGAAGELPDLRDVVLLRGPATQDLVGWDQFLARGRSVDEAEVAVRSAAVTPDDIALILFTSGSTGMPKGALLRGGAYTRIFTCWAEYMGVQRGDRILAINPFFHSLGFSCAILASLITGATNYPYAVWSPGDALDWVQRHQISVFPGPPAIFQGLLNLPQLGERDISSLRSAVTGAADIPENLVPAMWSQLGFETVLTGYGMTESSGVVSLSRPGADADRISKMDGKVLDDVEVKIVDDDGNEVPNGISGEILVRGYVVMDGYLDDPEATAEVIDPAGWYSTGDIGLHDDQDYIAVTGRKKDMFIVGGENAYPAEIEEVLGDHPDVGEIAVVGAPDERLGEIGVAFVVPAPGRELDPEALIAWAREQMANYKVPRHVWLVDALPLGASNKVAKLELAAEAEARVKGAAAGRDL